MLTFAFKELKLIKIIKNIKRGTKNISNKIFPKKLTKKLKPKIGIITKKIIKKVTKFLFLLGKVFI